jgi:hypothetical protein
VESTNIVNGMLQSISDAGLVATEQILNQTVLIHLHLVISNCSLSKIVTVQIHQEPGETYHFCEIVWLRWTDSGFE